PSPLQGSSLPDLPGCDLRAPEDNDPRMEPQPVRPSPGGRRIGVALSSSLTPSRWVPHSPCPEPISGSFQASYRQRRDAAKNSFRCAAAARGPAGEPAASPSWVRISRHSRPAEGRCMEIDSHLVRAASGRLSRLAALLALLLAGPAILILFFRSDRGLFGVYLTTGASGKDIVIATRQDPQVDFKVPQVLMSPYFQHWNLALLPIPASLPAFGIRWSGFVKTSVEGSHRFQVETEGRARLV